MEKFNTPNLTRSKTVNTSKTNPTFHLSRSIKYKKTKPNYNFLDKNTSNSKNCLYNSKDSTKNPKFLGCSSSRVYRILKTNRKPSTSSLLQKIQSSVLKIRQKNSYNSKALINKKKDRKRSFSNFQCELESYRNRDVFDIGKKATLGYHSRILSLNEPKIGNLSTEAIAESQNKNFNKGTSVLNSFKTRKHHSIAIKPKKITKKDFSNLAEAKEIKSSLIEFKRFSQQEKNKLDNLNIDEIKKEKINKEKNRLNFLTDKPDLSHRYQFPKIVESGFQNLNSAKRRFSNLKNGRGLNFLKKIMRKSHFVKISQISMSDYDLSPSNRNFSEEKSDSSSKNENKKSFLKNIKKIPEKMF